MALVATTVVLLVVWAVACVTPALGGSAALTATATTTGWLAADPELVATRARTLSPPAGMNVTFRRRPVDVLDRAGRAGAFVPVNPHPQRRELGVGDPGEQGCLGVRRVDAGGPRLGRADLRGGPGEVPQFLGGRSQQRVRGEHVGGDLTTWSMVSPAPIAANVPNPDSSSAGESSAATTVAVLGRARADGPGGRGIGGPGKTTMSPAP